MANTHVPLVGSSRGYGGWPLGCPREGVPGVWGLGPGGRSRAPKVLLRVPCCMSERVRGACSFLWPTLEE
eukprot:12764943-Alexandrium_andersonii.AAC.1